MHTTMKGISLKTVKEEDELMDKYVVKFEVITDDFDSAVDVAKDLEQNLENNLKGQTVLVGEKKKKKR